MVTNADWWANKLAQQNPTPQTRPANNLPSPPSQTPLPQMPSFQPNPTPPNVRSAQQTQLCPDCGSNNYMSVNNASPRCFECGYPVEQSGSRYGSLAGAHIEGSAKGALGNNPTSNWNPQGIIGRISD
jgi:ribosomal protein L37E